MPDVVDPHGRSRGLAGSSPLRDLVGVTVAVEIAVDADARALAKGYGREREFLARDLRRVAQRHLADRAVADAVAEEVSRAGVDPAPFQTADHALDDDVAFAVVAAVEDEVHARVGVDAARRGQRRLLADDGEVVAVEREHEAFHLAALGVRMEAVVLDPERRAVIEHEGLEEAEHGVDAAVVQEAETAHLGPLSPLSPGFTNGVAAFPNMPTFW